MQRHTRWVVGGIAAAVLFGPGLMHWAWLSWRRQGLARRVHELEALRQSLTDEQQRLADDPVYTENLIRSTFKVAKPGEVVVPLSSSDSPRK